MSRARLEGGEKRREFRETPKDGQGGRGGQVRGSASGLRHSCGWCEPNREKKAKLSPGGQEEGELPLLMPYGCAAGYPLRVYSPAGASPLTLEASARACGYVQVENKQQATDNEPPTTSDNAAQRQTTNNNAAQ